MVASSYTINKRDDTSLQTEPLFTKFDLSIATINVNLKDILLTEKLQLTFELNKENALQGDRLTYAAIMLCLNKIVKKNPLKIEF